VSAHGDLVALLLLVLASVIGPVVAVRVRLPTAVVLIFAGVGLGPAAANLVHDTAMVKLLSELGFLILMFIAGMEIDFDAIRAAGPAMLVRPTLASLGIGAIALGFGRLLGVGIVETLGICAMSIGMPLAVLQETGHIRSVIGRYVLLTGSIGEFFCILAITALEMVSGEGGAPEILMKVGKMTALFVASALAVRWARAIVWWFPGPFGRLVAHHDVAELGVRVGFALMFGFVVLSALFGVEPILGAFIAGALVSFVLRQKHVLESKIAAVGHGFFIPIFFVVVGLRFDPRVLDWAAVKLALVFSGAAFVSKLLPSLLGGWKEMGFRQRFAAGALLSAPLTLVVAVSTIGKELGLIDARIGAALMLMGMVVSIVFPVVFKLLVRKHAAASSAPGATDTPLPHG